MGNNGKRKNNCIALLCILLVFALTGCKSKDYSAAVGMQQIGEYDSAIRLFTELEDYKDSAKRIPACYYSMGERAMRNHKYEEAAEIFEQLGDYEDSEELLARCEEYIKALKATEELANSPEF